MILDSGNRTEFNTGAVRDIQEGKGRCDLLPLDVVGGVVYNPYYGNEEKLLFITLDEFVRSGNPEVLVTALHTFCEMNHWDRYSMALAVAKHMEEGSKKYGERNWEKGIPVSRYIDSATRHLLKHLRGDKDEPHETAFCWNLMCCIWTCIHKPELNEYREAEDAEKV